MKLFHIKAASIFKDFQVKLGFGCFVTFVIKNNKIQKNRYYLIFFIRNDVLYYVMGSN